MEPINPYVRDFVLLSTVQLFRKSVIIQWPYYSSRTHGLKLNHNPWRIPSGGLTGLSREGAHAAPWFEGPGGPLGHTRASGGHPGPSTEDAETVAPNLTLKNNPLVHKSEDPHIVPQNRTWGPPGPRTCCATWGSSRPLNWRCRLCTFTWEALWAPRESCK